MKKSVKIIICVLVLAIAVGVGVFALTRDSYGIDKKADVVLITNGSNVEDDIKTKGLWQGVKEYCENNNIKSNYIIPELDENSSLTTAKIGEIIDKAVENGATKFVLPDDNFEVAAYEYAVKYKDVDFLLIDGIPHSEGDDVMRTLTNVMPVKFNYMQAGFLAGYSCVQDGYTKLGFIGSLEDVNAGPLAGAFKQGATFAAQEKGIEVNFDYAEYDSFTLDYDYSINAKPIYESISSDAHKLTVVGGSGSGYYKQGQAVTIKADNAPKDKVFDCWQIDGKGATIDDIHNPSNAKATVGNSDATITAVYKDAKTQEVVIKNEDGSVYETLNVVENTTVEISAPVANRYFVFSEWECNASDAISDKNAKDISVSVKDSPITLTPKYLIATYPTFNVNVENGSGAGGYVSGDNVELVANSPEDGYMFTGWEIVDANGYKVVDEGVDLSNPNLEFTMSNRFKTLANKFIDNGVEVILTNDIEIENAAIDYSVMSQKGKVYSASNSNENYDKLLGYVEFDYKTIVKRAFKEFKGGSIFSASVENSCLSLSNKSASAQVVNEKGKKVANENYNSEYALVYNGLSNGKYKIIHLKTGADISLVAPSENLKLNYWIIKG